MTSQELLEWAEAMEGGEERPNAEDAREIAAAMAELEALVATREARIEELLLTVRRLGQGVPFPEEWKDWEGQRAKLLAEVGTLRAKVVDLEAGFARVHDAAVADAARIIDLELAKNAAYRERNQCVAALAWFAYLLKWNVWIARHDEADTAWDREWMNVVFIDLPTGQVSWHFHDRELPMFTWLHDGAYPGRPWDGHSTDEKYSRLLALVPPPVDQ